jgi:uncharacterized membrane protein
MFSLAGRVIANMKRRGMAGKLFTGIVLSILVALTIEMVLFVIAFFYVIPSH